MRIVERNDEVFSTLTRETKAVVKFVDEPPIVTILNS